MGEIEERKKKKRKKTPLIEATWTNNHILHFM